MDADSLVKLAIAVTFFLVQLLIRSSKNKDTSESQPSSSAPPEETSPPPMSPIEPQQIQNIQQQAAELIQRIAKLPKHTRILGEALKASIQQDSETTNKAPREYPSDEAREHYERANLRLLVIKELLRMRQSARVGAHLADAEALADSFLKPFRQLSQSSAFAFARHAPICALAQSEQEAIWMGLLPNTYPLIFVPRDFGQNLYRWGSLPHEIGHLVWHRAPGLADEVRDRFLPSQNGRIPIGNTDGTIKVDPKEPYGAWLSEIFADFFAIMMMGPSALKSFIVCFKNPEDPNQVCLAHEGENSHFSPHPPSHLRVLLSARLLVRMGFATEAKNLVQEWNQEHQDPTHLLLPSWGPTIGQFILSVPVKNILEAGEELVINLYQHRYQSLDGREPRSIHGLVYSPGSDALVKKLAPILARGQAVRAEPQWIVTAAIRAASEHPQNLKQIKEAVAQSIIGRNTDEKPSLASQQKASFSTSLKQLTPKDIQSAIILRELLPRRRRQPLFSVQPPKNIT
ncbi:MAG: hypothetical protein KTR25_19725 [Myxococcales bacterium]|nr:hypothetical protein [Myxococcales bacterium]